MLLTAPPDANTARFTEGNDSHLKNKLEKYISEEYPYYSEADIIVETKEEQVDNTVLRVIEAIDNFLFHLQNRLNSGF